MTRIGAFLSDIARGIAEMFLDWLGALLIVSMLWLAAGLPLLLVANALVELFGTAAAVARMHTILWIGLALAVPVFATLPVIWFEDWRRNRIQSNNRGT